MTKDNATDLGEVRESLVQSAQDIKAMIDALGIVEALLGHEPDISRRVSALEAVVRGLHRVSRIQSVAIVALIDKINRLQAGSTGGKK